MHWSTAWLGKRYRREGRGPLAYDCLGFFIAVQAAQFGRHMDYGIVPEGPAEVAAHQTYFVDGPQWSRVATAKEGDALLFTRGRGFHIGVALTHDTMLHCANPEQGSVIEPFRARKWGTRLAAIYEWVPDGR